MTTITRPTIVGPSAERRTGAELLGTLAAATVRDMAELAEFAEGYSMDEMTRAMPAGAAARFGARVERIGPAVAQVAAVDVPFFNRVVGLGLREPITDGLLDAIHALYRGANVRYMLQLSPAVLNRELHARLEARGLKRLDNWVQLVRGSEPPPAIRTELRIEQVGPAYAESLTAIVCDAFGLGHECGPFIAGLIGRPGWWHYAAFAGETPVATGALFVRGLVGYLTFGATDASYRRQGAQGAIMARRIRDAAALGCHWLVTTAVEETPDHPNPSYHNMLRTGFRVAYARPNYVYFPRE